VKCGFCDIKDTKSFQLRADRSTGSRLLDVQICHSSFAWLLKRRLIPVASGLFMLLLQIIGQRKKADSCLQIMICELIKLQLKLAGALNDADLERMRARYEIQRNSLSLKLIPPSS
jgi:hypothetical protein